MKKSIKAKDILKQYKKLKKQEKKFRAEEDKQLNEARDYCFPKEKNK